MTNEQLDQVEDHWTAVHEKVEAEPVGVEVLSRFRGVTFWMLLK
jgi:hypothetical protein